MDYDLALLLGFKDQAVALRKIPGITRFRWGEYENCVAHHHAQSAIFPVQPGARFTGTAHAEEAIKDFLQYLEHKPHDLITAHFSRTPATALA